MEAKGPQLTSLGVREARQFGNVQGPNYSTAFNFPLANGG